MGPAGSGAAFTSIGDAIAAAAPGDLILVEPGTYSGFELDKPLTILGAGPGVIVNSAMNTPGVRIRDLALGQEAVVAGITVKGIPSQSLDTTAAPLVVVRDVLGVAVLQNLTLVLATDVQPLSESLRVRDTAALFLLDSIVEGYDENAVLSGGFGTGTGMTITGSEAWILGCLVTGGDGAPLSGWAAADGGPGIVAIGSTLRLARSTVLGGSGGGDFFGAAGDGGPAVRLVGGDLQHCGGPVSALEGGAGAGTGTTGSGASAVEAAGPSSVLVAPDVTASAGHDGSGGTTAPAYSIDPNSTLASYATLRPTLGTTPTALQLGSSYVLEYDSQAYAIGLHWISLHYGAPTAIQGLDGDLVLDPGLVFHLPSLFADQSGHAETTVGVPNHPALVGLRIVHQLFEVATDGVSLIASSPASVLLRP